jgi:hypothetical protein
LRKSTSAEIIEKKREASLDFVKPQKVLNTETGEKFKTINIPTEGKESNREKPIRIYYIKY